MGKRMQNRLDTQAAIFDAAVGTHRTTGLRQHVRRGDLRGRRRRTSDLLPPLRDQGGFAPRVQPPSGPRRRGAGDGPWCSRRRCAACRRSLGPSTTRGHRPGRACADSAATLRPSPISPANEPIRSCSGWFSTSCAAASPMAISGQSFPRRWPLRSSSPTSPARPGGGSGTPTMIWPHSSIAVSNSASTDSHVRQARTSRSTTATAPRWSDAPPERPDNGRQTGHTSSFG